MKSVLLIGHNAVKETQLLLDVLKLELESIAKEGMEKFYVGNENQWDKLCLRLLAELKIIYPQIHIFPKDKLNLNECEMCIYCFPRMTGKSAYTIQKVCNNGVRCVNIYQVSRTIRILLNNEKKKQQPIVAVTKF